MEVAMVEAVLVLVELRCCYNAIAIIRFRPPLCEFAIANLLLRRKKVVRNTFGKSRLLLKRDSCLNVCLR